LKKLPSGKIPPETLKKIVLRFLGANRKEVILGPTLGEDGAIIQANDKILISSMDPITGAVERIGWLAVNICANDVVTFGVPPAFFSSCILLPENSNTYVLEEICSQIDKAAKNLGIAVIGGHSEITPGISNPIVVGHCMGITTKNGYVTTGGAKPGNSMILTKTAGIEGTAVLATDYYKVLKEKIDPKILDSAKKFFESISVVKEAILAFNTGGVNAMHDPTEGGVIGGIHEMADASKVGVKVFEDKVPVAEETVEICRFFGIDALYLISSGALLIAAEKEKEDEIIRVLRKNGVKASVIGEFTSNLNKRVLVRKDGVEAELPRAEMDHLWIALEKYRSMRI